MIRSRTNPNGIVMCAFSNAAMVLSWPVICCPETGLLWAEIGAIIP